MIKKLTINDYSLDKQGRVKKYTNEYAYYELGKGWVLTHEATDNKYIYPNGNTKQFSEILYEGEYPMFTWKNGKIIFTYFPGEFKVHGERYYSYHKSNLLVAYHAIIRQGHYISSWDSVYYYDYYNGRPGRIVRKNSPQDDGRGLDVSITTIKDTLTYDKSGNLTQIKTQYNDRVPFISYKASFTNIKCPNLAYSHSPNNPNLGNSDQDPYLPLACLSFSEPCNNVATKLQSACYYFDYRKDKKGKTSLWSELWLNFREKNE